MPRPNPRNRLAQMAREAERALTEQRASTLPTPADLDREAVVKRSDVDAAISLWAEANAGSDMARLLDGPSGEGEQS